MSKITAKSTKSAILAAYEDAIRELELVKRQLADAMTEKGALLSQLASQEAEIPQAFQESYAALVDERNQLIAENQRLTEAAVAVTEELDAAKERLAKQGQVIAAQPKSAPLVLPKPAPKPQVPAQPIASPEAHEALRVFGSLTSAQRSAVLKATGAKVVNLGNILEIQAAWHSRKSA